MRIVKVKIENLFGIEQEELDGSSIELTGTNGVGKSSVLDAIRLALTNNSKRKYVVKNGEKEGRILVKLDDGTIIDRKKRTDKSDYKSIKDVNGNEIGSPEAFLKDIFTPLQLEPVEFLSMTEKEQNRLLLNLIEFNRDKKEFIKEKFKELPSWVDYDESILEILNNLQSKDGEYYQAREDINRDIRNGLAIVNDIAKNIPEDYDAKKWRKYTLSEKYQELNENKKFNDKIERCIKYKEDYNKKIKTLETEETNKILLVEKEKEEERSKINEKIAEKNKEIVELQNQIKLLEQSIEGLDNKYAISIETIKKESIETKTLINENLKVADEWIKKEAKDTETLEKELEIAEEMKGHLNEYDRMSEMQTKIEKMKETSQAYTDKIELARDLPGVILKEANIPVKNLTVEGGIPLVNGLPIGNLSEGEKLMLCVDVTLSNPNSLKLILIDGVERLSESNRKDLYRICKEKGLQCIATRTTDSDTLNVVEL